MIKLPPEWHFQKNHHNSDGSRSSKCPFLPLVLDKKSKNELTKYRGVFMSFKSRVYSKQEGLPHFSLFGSWAVVLYILVKAKFFLITLT